MDPIFVPFIVVAGIIISLALVWAAGALIAVAFSTAAILAVAIVHGLLCIAEACLADAQAKHIEREARRHDHGS